MPPREDKDSSKDQTTTPKTNNGDKNTNKHVEASTEDLTQVADPVKAFQEDMEMEGYTGTIYNVYIIINLTKKNIFMS